MNALTKAFGKESVIKMKDARPLDVVSTGQLSLDWGVLGIGGLPKGYFVEIYGKEKAGKTSLILSIMAHCQQNNIVPIVIDPKLSVADDMARAKRIGVNIDEVVLVPLHTSEQAMGMVQNAVETAQKNKFDVMVFWDDMSLSDTTDTRIGNKARLVWEFCRKLGGLCYRTGTTVIIANHLIAKIGGFGGMFTTTGGGGSRALARIRLLVTNKGKWEKSGERIGNKVEVKTEANAFYAPYRKALLYLHYHDGYDNAKSVLENGVENRIVTKTRGSYAYKESKGKSGIFTDESLLDLCKDIWPEPFGLEKKKMVEIVDGEDFSMEDIYIDD